MHQTKIGQFFKRVETGLEDGEAGGRQKRKASSPPESEKAKKRDKESPKDSDKDSSRTKDKNEKSSKNLAKDKRDDSLKQDKDSPKQDKDSPKDKDKDSPKGKDKDSPKGKDKDFPKGKGKDSPKDKDKESPKGKDKDSHKDMDKDSHKDKDKESLKGKDKDSPKGKDKEKRNDSTRDKDKDNESPKGKYQGVTRDKSSATSASLAPTGWDNDYNPAMSMSKYNPIDDASWEQGKKVPYLAFSRTLEAIEATSSRLRNMEILANYFRSVIVLTPEDLVFSIYLCLNKLAPAYEGVELGIAETNIMKAIAQATGRSFASIKADASAQGDLGLVAETSRSNQRTLSTPQPLTVAGVFQKLKDIASLTGSASMQKKNSMITSLLVSCKYSEARYLTRSLAGKLRIGLAEQSLLQALAQACFLTPPEQDRPVKILNAGKKLSVESLKAKLDEEALRLKSCFCECPNYDLLVEGLLKEGIRKLPQFCSLRPGIPPRPMLAQPTKGIPEVLHRFEGIKFTCEYKYDGERAQIHLLDDGSVKVFSRNQEDNTSKYPDIVHRFSSSIKGNVKSCILDSEAVAWDVEKESILPFQVLSTRKRKDAKEEEIKVQVQLFAFDLLYLNGEPLVKKPLIERRQLLHDNFQPVKGQFTFATSIDTESVEEVQEFLEESVKRNCEGLMVKTLDIDASYELAKRSQKWLKLKKDYLESGGDSLDLVVIGGFLGKGRRTGTYGGFLLASYNPETEEYQTICKLGTGFSDEDLQSHTERLKAQVIPRPKSYYSFSSQLTPDQWFDATEVWEVKCADLSLSPVHTAAVGIADPDRGISLRFPRFLRIREDKKIEDATSARQVAQMYQNQDIVKNSSKDKKWDDDEFY